MLRHHKKKGKKKKKTFMNDQNKMLVFKISIKSSARNAGKIKQDNINSLYLKIQKKKKIRKIINHVDN